MADTLQIVTNQLMASGKSKREAEKLIRKCLRQKPTDGAASLAREGANYGDAFKLFSASGSSPASGRGKIGVGLVLLFVSYFSGGLIATGGQIVGIIGFISAVFGILLIWSGFRS